MKFKTIILEAGAALKRNNVRSALTILGIAVGVGAFICVIAIGNAGTSSIERQLQNLGDNFVWVEAGSRSRNGVRYGARGDRTLILQDATAIRDQVPLIKHVAQRRWTLASRLSGRELVNAVSWCDAGIPAN